MVTIDQHFCPCSLETVYFIHRQFAFVLLTSGIALRHIKGDMIGFGLLLFFGCGLLARRYGHLAIVVDCVD